MVFLPNRWQLGFFERRVTFFPKASSMLGFSFSCLTAWGASCFERWCADGVGARERKGKESNRRDRKGKEGKGRERKGKKGKEREKGKGRERKGKEGKEREKGKGRERKGKEGKGRERKGTEGTGRERKGKEGKGRQWLEMGREKKPLGMSELGCADGCGRSMGRKKKLLEISELACADGCGRRGSKGVAGNGWGEEVAGDERAWLRGRLRTAWVQGSGWKWMGRRSHWG